MYKSERRRHEVSISCRNENGCVRDYSLSCSSRWKLIAATRSVERSSNKSPSYAVFYLLLPPVGRANKKEMGRKVCPFAAFGRGMRKSHRSRPIAAKSCLIIDGYHPSRPTHTLILLNISFGICADRLMIHRYLPLPISNRRLDGISCKMHEIDKPQETFLGPDCWRQGETPCRQTGGKVAFGFVPQKWYNIVS